MPAVGWTILDDTMDSIVGPEGTQAHLKLRVTLSATLSEPARVVDVPDPAEPFPLQEYFDLTTSPIGDPPHIEFSFLADNLVATLRSTTPWPVTITATPKKCEGAGDYDHVFSEYTVSGNIEAPYVDIGARYGLALPPAKLYEFVYIDLRANLGTQNLREINVVFTWKAGHILYGGGHFRFYACQKGIDLKESTEFSCGSRGSNGRSIKVKNDVDAIVYPSSVIFATMK